MILCFWLEGPTCFHNFHHDCQNFYCVSSRVFRQFSPFSKNMNGILKHRPQIFTIFTEISKAPPAIKNTNCKIFTAISKIGVYTRIPFFEKSRNQNINPDPQPNPSLTFQKIVQSKLKLKSNFLNDGFLPEYYYLFKIIESK